MSRTAFDAALDKKIARKEAEAAGAVSDSGAVRLALMQRVHSGEITLEQAQAELKKIKRDGKKAGLVTRAQAYNRG